VRSALFKILQNEYQTRDRFRLVIKYRRTFIEVLLSGGEDEAAQVENEYASEKIKSDKEYQEAAEVADDQKVLSEAEQIEIKGIWRKLVRIFHPDRYINEPEKMEVYEKLTGLINAARDKGDIDLLREIADDPNKFIARQGWGDIDLHEEKDLNSLRKLYEILEIKIVDTLSLINELNESADYELYQICSRNESALQDMAAKFAEEIKAEIEALETEAAALNEQIQELTGSELF